MIEYQHLKKNSGKSRPEKKTRKQRKTSITYKKNSRIISKNAQNSIKRRNVKIRRLQLNDVINMVTKLLYYMSHESNNQKNQLEWLLHDKTNIQHCTIPIRMRIDSFI